jgi:ElaB/YqjD/DUF883 family membrane-anchored ribosome-binding protein
MENVFQNMEQARLENPREKVKEDLKALVRDAEELLKATASDMNDKTKEVRIRLGEALDRAKSTCDKLEKQTSNAVKATDKAICQHPYRAAGIALGVGVLIGFLFKRK